MRLGLHYWSYSRPVDPAAIAATLGETARIAEAAEVTAFSVMDHFVQLEGPAAADDPMLEGYSTLAYAGMGVSEVQVMPDRHPVEYTEQLAAQVVPRLAEVA